MAKTKKKKASNTLDLALAAVEKKHGVALRWLKDVPSTYDFFSTGCLGLDYALGGGLVGGRIVEVFGEESSGKTSLALNTIAQANAAGHVAFFADIERALHPALPVKYGVDPTKFILDNAPVNVETHFDVIESVIGSGAVSVCVLDSVPALITRAEMDAATDKEFMGKIPKFLSEKIRRLIQLLGESNTLFIFINQTRSKIGAYGDPTTTPGGAAIKFYATHRIRVGGGASKSSRVISDTTGEVVGHKMRFEVVKNKISSPFKKGDITLLYGQGYDTVGELVDIGVSFGLIDQGGAWYSYDDQKWQGKSNVRTALIEDDMLRHLLKGDIKTFLNMPLSPVEMEAMASKVEDDVEPDSE